MNALHGSGAWFDDVRVGDRFGSALTVTETHIVIGAGLIGDFNPHHMNAEFAKSTRFGTPILHGMLTSSIMGAGVGMYFHGTAIAYLEHRARFIAPVRAGDTLTTTWTVTDAIAKPRHGGGIVVLSGSAANQAGIVVAEAEARIMVAARSPHPATAAPDDQTNARLPRR
jgi:acyl dehydratase